MPKNFYSAILLIITVFFIFGCSQQENPEMEHRVSEEQTRQWKIHQVWMNTPIMLQRWHPQMKQRRFGSGLVLCTRQSKCQNPVAVQFVKWI